MTLLNDDTAARGRWRWWPRLGRPGAHEPGLQGQVCRAHSAVPVIMLNGADVRPSRAGPPHLSTGSDHASSRKVSRDPPWGALPSLISLPLRRLRCWSDLRLMWPI